MMIQVNLTNREIRLIRALLVAEVQQCWVEFNGNSSTVLKGLAKDNGEFISGIADIFKNLCDWKED